ncbi:MAG: NAD(+) synthase [Chloroflexi bacterium]|nr:NAD(+) synthase [Chloroflexota bacterium]
MRAGEEFFNLYNHDFVRVAVAIPPIKVADTYYNTQQTIDLMEKGAAQGAALALFPELGISAYSCEDLFHQRALLDGCLAGLDAIRAASTGLELVAVVGLPLLVDHHLFNCAAVVARGRILGIIPKTYLPNYREFYEARQFSPADTTARTEIDLCGQTQVPFSNRLLFQLDEQPLFTFHVEICEDLWVPVPPSSLAALAGATVLLNLSASNITIGKATYRHQLVSSQSARCLAAYLYSAAGPGESTTDLAWDGHAVIYENGNLLAESLRFHYQPQLVVTELDLERLSQERARQTTFNQLALREHGELRSFRTVPFSLDLPRTGRQLLHREYERFPYVPADPKTRDERCFEVYQIQVQGLAKRMEFAHIEKAVIGVSGGLDSTQALLVCAHTMDLLGLPRSNILTYTMPGFATTSRTKEQAHQLMRALGCTAHELDIRPSALQMLKDLDHPFSRGEPVYDVTFENVQAGERTSHLFRLANHHNGLVVGTGDLSELALGWATYGVGDHMSHYNVNASVPKTLIQHVIRWVAQTGQLGPEVSDTLLRILATEISPELVPGDPSGTEPAQSTEKAIGPYGLQDFNLYYTLRFGYSPTKVAFLAYSAWHDRERGAWPDIPPEKRNQYSIEKIKKNLGIFLFRFFQLSQYKRSCIPNAPKVGSGGSLSPRGDYRAPSDSEATVWLRELERVPDHE